MRNLFKPSFYTLVLVSLMLMSVNNSYARSRYDVIGLDSEDFYEEIKAVIDSFQDYKAHTDKGETKYSNDLFKPDNTDSTRVVVKDHMIVSLLIYLSYISDIDINVPSGYARGNNPKVKPLTELIDFLSEDDRYLDYTIFSAYLAYLTWDYYMSIAYSNPLTYEQMVSMDGVDTDDFIVDYSKKYPKSFYGRIFRIFLISEKIFDAIHGYLKAPEVPLNPKEETPQAESYLYPLSVSVLTPKSAFYAPIVGSRHNAVHLRAEH